MGQTHRLILIFLIFRHTAGAAVAVLVASMPLAQKLEGGRDAENALCAGSSSFVLSSRVQDGSGHGFAEYHLESGCWTAIPMFGCYWVGSLDFHCLGNKGVSH